MYSSNHIRDSAVGYVSIIILRFFGMSLVKSFHIYPSHIYPDTHDTGEAHRTPGNINILPITHET
jgi:hypothetical protein